MATIRQLEYLVAVVEEGGFTPAARRCGVTQPSLSQQIQTLEALLGEKLVSRQGRRIEATSAGLLAYEKALAVLDQHHDLLAAFDFHAEARSGMVVVGIIPTMAPQMLPPMLVRFRRRYPRVQVQIREAQTSDLVQMAAAGEVDFAVLSDVEDGEVEKHALEVRRLHREAIFLAAPAAHALALRGGRVKVDEIDPDHLVTLTEGHCLRGQSLTVCRREPSPDAVQCEQMATLMAMVASGLGLTFIPEMAIPRFAGEGIRFLPLGPPSPSRAINLMHCRLHGVSLVAQALIELVEDYPFGRKATG